MSGPEDIIRELASDYVHGASYYYDRSVDLFELLNRYDEGYAKALAETRPGMASVMNVIEAFRIGAEMGLPTSKVAKALRRIKAESEDRLSEYSLEASSVATVSFSSNVLNLIKRSQVKHVYLIDTEPSLETKAALEALSKFATVTLIPLSSSYSYVEYSEAFLSGFDGLYSSGHFVNKAGTFEASCAAREKGVKTVIVGESFKAYDGFPPPPLKVKWNGISVPLFESVPLRYVDVLITDMGQIERPEPEDVYKIKNGFLEWVKSYLAEGDL
ncbi:MAG: hypothetical protein ACP5GH_00300 [Nitrososphaeria archaeon]